MYVLDKIYKAGQTWVKSWAIIADFRILLILMILAAGCEKQSGKFDISGRDKFENRLG